MAYSKTQIANLALSHLGTRFIDDINDADSIDSAVLLANYNHSRDAIYESHDWRWAKRTVQLQQQLAAPVVRFGYAYALPANFRRLSNVSESSRMYPPLDDFDLADGKLTANAGTVFMEYVSSHWLEGSWPSYFADCVALKLAIISCLRLTNGMIDKRELQRMLDQQVLPNARAADSQMQSPVKRLFRSTWTATRFGSRFGTIRTTTVA